MNKYSLSQTMNGIEGVDSGEKFFVKKRLLTNKSDVTICGSNFTKGGNADRGF